MLSTPWEIWVLKSRQRKRTSINLLGLVLASMAEPNFAIRGGYSTSRAEQSNPNASLKFFFILSRHRQNPFPGSGLTRSAARRVYVSISTFCLSLGPSSSATAAIPAVANGSSCPMDFNYVLRIAWSFTSCLNYEPTTVHPRTSEISRIPCCQTLLSPYSMALADWPGI
ncbi:hypothetical protein PanWU01x14_000530 [Parasponia andersonii]|uniref:SPARK domain-containing protein n=1 Tax=Parasponia andersonii TaxID=3476 RepID=A0A2P5E4L8_PARAD|nr:hypothetical protein PanWU01x14_000530 [Parasponia andersonii]